MKRTANAYKEGRYIDLKKVQKSRVNQGKKKKEKIVAIEYRGEKFSGYNKPKRTPKHKTKSHAVLAKSGDKVKLIRFGQQGVKGAGKNPSSKSQKLEELVSKHDMRKI